LLFLPAAGIGLYAFFLVALFVMACGQSFLEVAANPYVTILGAAQSAERRLNFAQSFNAVGATISPLLGRALILTGVEYSPGQTCLNERSGSAGLSCSSSRHGKVALSADGRDFHSGRGRNLLHSPPGRD